WDPNTGAELATTTLSLPPNGHTSRFLTELFPGVANIRQIRAKFSLDECSTSACTSAGGNGFLATAVRLNGDQFTTIPVADRPPDGDQIDRKSTRLNSSHVAISYAVFCLKKKKNNRINSVDNTSE